MKTVLKRGALVAAANWQVTAIQFVAESTFKMLLSVPIVGGVLLVVLVLGRELPEVFSSDIRTSLTFVATALTAEPLALVAFLMSFALVGLAGSGLMFLLKGGTVAVLARGEREAELIEEPPLRLKPFLSAARFSIEGFHLGCGLFLRRYLRLGLILIVVYVVSGSAYLGVLLGGYRWFVATNLGWTAVAGIGSTALVAWITLVNFLYLLVQMVVVVEDCSVRAAARRAARFLRADARLVLAVFGVVLLLVAGATTVSLIATTSLGLIAFVPLAGLAVIPLQLLAWLFRGLVFQYLGLSALGAYLTLYRRHAAPDAAAAATPAL
ncbi:MAG: hypothetical protein NTY02_15730 [Acidobacteria bacterium]|nr:hypothetical protein [Acidobacteriota bacterium]